MSSEPGPGVRAAVDGRRAAWLFAVVEVGAFPLLLLWGRGWWFFADDWDFLAGRTAGSFGDLFRAHYQHWTTLPILAYRLLWVLVGIRSYVPYQVLVIVAHLAAVALLRVVMRRAGVRPWLATVVAIVFVFFGAGAENIVIAFQITFVGSLVFGLTQLLLADHDGPVDRRDWLALAAGFAGLMCSGVAVAMTIIVGIAMLLRRGWRIALLQTGPLAIAYVIWSRWSPRGASAGSYRGQSVTQVLHFVAIGVEDVFARLGHVTGFGILLAALTIVGLALVLRTQGLGGLRGRYALPVALLAGALVFLVLTGVVRSGQPNVLSSNIGVGPGRARQSRYVYIVAALALPAIGLAAEAIVERRRKLAIPLAVVLLVGLPGNINLLRNYTKMSAKARAEIRTDILEAPRLPLARQFPAYVAPAPFGGLTMGWLVASLPSGRIPGPGPISPTRVATETLRLALRAPPVMPALRCEVVRKPVIRVLVAGQHLSIDPDFATFTYFPPHGAASDPVAFPYSKFVAAVGPIKIRITPLGDRLTVCG